MRYFIFFLMLFCLTLSAQTNNIGSKKMETGKGDEVMVKYHIESSDLEKFPKEKLDMMIWSAQEYSKRDCKNQASFRPSKKSVVYISRIAGGWHLTFNFLAQNAYGAEAELSEEVIFDKQFNYVSHSVKQN